MNQAVKRPDRWFAPDGISPPVWFLVIALLFALVFLILTAWSLASWKIDPGAASFFSATLVLIGLGIQARLALRNLLDAQREQADHASNARAHQLMLDEKKIENADLRERKRLATTLWAEFSSISDRIKYVDETEAAYRAIREKDTGQPHSIKAYVPNCFDLPLYESNLNKLGLLPIEIAEDVVRVATLVSGTRVPYESDTLLPFATFADLHVRELQHLKDCVDRLDHVCQELESMIFDNVSSPGSLRLLEAG